MDKRRGELGGLPSGWKREEVVRKSGLSVGKTDVYYFSPDGNKIRSKPMLSRYLGDSFDLSAFDFRSGRIVHSALRKSKQRSKGSAYDISRGIRHDSSLALPIRQTASIFKQPVSLIKNRQESQTKNDLKHGPQDPPKQLFWEKRLQGMKASDSGSDVLQPLDLPRNVQGVGPELSTENILQSISACLHLSNNVPVTGQANNKATLTKNPGVHIDTSQPHIQQMIVSEEDIRRQEMKVMEARRKLQDVMKGLM